MTTDLREMVYAAAIGAGASQADAYRLSVAGGHPCNWRDYAGVVVGACGGAWVATWTHDGGVGPDYDAL